ncbi:MAG: hypothetical protein AB1402_09540, partial [Bacillota bacterium]
GYFSPQIKKPGLWPDFCISLPQLLIPAILSRQSLTNNPGRDTLGQARRISDHLGFFLDGRLVEYGVAADVFTNPREKTTEDYLVGNFG